MYKSKSSICWIFNYCSFIKFASIPFLLSAFAGDNEFDAVTIAEVLDHLFEDYIALKEIRRVLKDDGVLIVTVPFYSNGAEYHVRIHSDKTVKRLLKYCGFEIENFIYKGGHFLQFPDMGLILF